MAPQKRKREHSPAPATPARARPNGILTPPSSSAKRVVKQSPRQAPRRNLLAYFAAPERVVKEEHQDGQAQERDVVVKREEEQVRLDDLPTQHPLLVAIKNEENGNGRIKDEDIATRDPTPPIKQEPAVKDEVPDSVYRFPFEYAPYNGQTVSEVPESFLKQLYINGNIERSPNLKKAIVEWASRWTLTFGIHEGKLLDDVPIAYFNKFFLNWGKLAEPKNDGLCVALRYHLPYRTPEVPGSRYKLTFSQYRGCTIEEAIERSRRTEWDGRESDFISWAKEEGVPEQDNYEDLAEAIEFHAQETALSFMLERPHVADFRAPDLPCFGEWRNLPITQVPDYLVESLRLEHSLDELNDMAPGLEDAFQYFDLVRDTCRWNWRRDPTCETHHGLGPLLYPTTAEVPNREAGFVESWGYMWERVQASYSMTNGEANTRGHKKWVWKLVGDEEDSDES